MEGFAALAGGGADEDDVAAGCALVSGWDCIWATAAWTEAEDAVEVGAEGAAPLGGGHGGDGGVVRGPDAVVDDGAVETAEGGDGGGDEGLAVFGVERGCWMARQRSGPPHSAARASACWERSGS